jgi:hypothetical protein
MEFLGPDKRPYRTCEVLVRDLYGNATNQELAQQWRMRCVLLWVPIKEFVKIAPLHAWVFFR